MDEKQNSTEFPIRAFKPGDEANLVAFLNLCFPGGASDDMEQWKWIYPRDPAFTRDNIFIIESNHRIIGHRGLHPRELSIRGKKVPVALLGATATHPDYRGRGLYGKLHQATLKAAKSKGACLAHTWNSRGSITYHHNKKTGFIEINQGHTYLKLINAERVFKGEILDFIARREELRNLLRELKTNLYVYFGKAEYSLEELLNGDKPTLTVSRKKGEVRIILSQKSFPGLVEFASSGKLRKIKSILCLLLSRQMKIGFSSPLALARVAWAGAKMARHV